MDLRHIKVHRVVQHITMSYSYFKLLLTVEVVGSVSLKAI